VTDRFTQRREERGSLVAKAVHRNAASPCERPRNLRSEPSLATLLRAGRW
jgi:hypothetical protein